MERFKRYTLLAGDLQKSLHFWQSNLYCVTQFCPKRSDRRSQNHCQSVLNIYIIIHQNMIERTEQKVQQKSTHKKRRKKQQ